MPTVSDITVIIPYYNREEYIDEAIQSVLAQTLKPLEILVVNDCSRESSRRYLERYAKVCTIMDLPVNVGLAGSRNAGMRAARGQFIALLDDDDIWLPQKLEQQRKFLEQHPECSGIHTAVWAMLPNRDDVLYYRFAPGPMTLAQALTNDHWVIPSTMMFRTDVLRALGGFDPPFRQCEDRDLIIRFCAAGYQIQGIPEPLAKLRRQGQASLTDKSWRIFRTDLKMCWKHRALYFRAYGLRGVVSFVMEKIQLPSSRTRYVDGAVRRLNRFVKVKYEVKSSYREPVGSKQFVAVSQKTGLNESDLIERHSL
jgi:glycosyltransferase involved in cell wall biosynthesis